MEQGLAPRSDDLAVSFEDIQRLQSLMDDTAFICSKEYEELTKSVQSNFAIRMVFQVAGIPTSDTFKERRCGKGPSKPLVDNIVQESLDHPERGPEEPTPEEPDLPTTEASDEQVEAAIQKVDGSETSLPTIQNPSTSSKSFVEKSEESQASLPPTIKNPETPQKQEELQTQEESQTPSKTLLPTIRKRGGRSLRRGH